MPVGGGDHGTGAESNGAIKVLAADTFAGAEASSPIGVTIFSSDSFGTHDSAGSPGELGTVPRAAQFPEPIPSPVGLFTGPAGFIPGNGWTVTVASHADFYRRLAELPRFQSLQISKILNDKGAGTVVVNRDDPALWPVSGPVAFNPNPDFGGTGQVGTILGWSATGGTLALSQAELNTLPWSALLTPGGAGTVTLTGSKFSVIQGLGYMVSAKVGTTGAWAPEPGSGILTVALAAGFSWYDQNNNLISTVMGPTSYLGVHQWLPLSSASVFAPLGAQYAVVVVQMLQVSGFSPQADNAVYLQQVHATYDSGNVALGDLLLDYEHLWQVWKNGKVVFDFLGETPTEQVDDPSEQRLATITGPGTIATLAWAAAMPPGFPEIIFKTDALQDGFAEVDQFGNPQLDTGIWNQASPLSHIALSPLGTCQLTASPTGTFLGAAPYDLTSSSVSFQISPIPQAGLDGSQLTQFYVQDVSNPNFYLLMGLSATQFYARVSTPGINTGSGASPFFTVQTKVFGTYDPNGDQYWRISETGGFVQFWSSPDGQTWTLLWEVEYISPQGWRPTDITVFVTATYDVDESQTVLVTNLNSDIITPTSQGNIFLLQPIVSVWLQLFEAAQDRGTIPFVATQLTTATDSFGNPWADANSVQVQNGTDLYSLFQGYAGIVNADYVMQPGLNLQLGLPRGGPSGGVGLGQDKSKQVVIRESAQLLTRQRIRARDNIGNLVGAVNSDGTVVVDSDATSIASWGQRETWIQTAAQVNEAAMETVVAASLGQTKDEVLSWTLTVQPDNPGASVFEDYDVGDWIGVERPGIAISIIDAMRVIGIAVAIDATGLVTCELTLASYRQWLQEQFQYLVNKFGGQFIETIGTTPVTSTSGGPGSLPKVVTPGLGGLADVNIG